MILNKEKTKLLKDQQFFTLDQTLLDSKTSLNLKQAIDGGADNTLHDALRRGIDALKEDAWRFEPMLADDDIDDQMHVPLDVKPDERDLEIIHLSDLEKMESVINRLFDDTDVKRILTPFIDDLSTGNM